VSVRVESQWDAPLKKFLLLRVALEGKPLAADTFLNASRNPRILTTGILKICMISTISHYTNKELVCGVL
jgi:hypothetical protein